MAKKFAQEHMAKRTYVVVHDGGSLLLMAATKIGPMGPKGNECPIYLVYHIVGSISAKFWAQEMDK